MKKLLIVFLCINFFCLPSYGMITDEFAEKTLNKNLKIKQYEPSKLTDEFAEKTLSKNLKITSYSYIQISDDFAEKNTGKNNISKTNTIVEEILPNIKNIPNRRKIVIFDKANAQQIPIRIKNFYSTKQNLSEGDYIEFLTIKKINIKNQSFPEGSVIKARIENISPNQSMGIPADVIIGNFSINNIPLSGEIHITGANRTLWVYPSSIALSLLLGIGFAITPIRGGHAKIKPHKTFVIYAENIWFELLTKMKMS